ncbi:unnamed protein product [Heterobilharzia americana]|nr:unnamed protein product [Heterobilharzia americana]
MEAFIARLAVYDWTGLRRLFSSVVFHLSALPSSTNVLILIFSIILLISVTAYSFRKVQPKKLDKRYTNSPGNGFWPEYENVDTSHLLRLYKSNNFTASMFCNFWLAKVNDYLNDALGKGRIHLNPVSECTLSDVKVSDFEIHHEDSPGSLTLYFSVSIPMLCMYADFVSKENELSQKITLSLKNYFMKMSCKVQFNEIVLLRLRMCATSAPQFDLTTDTSLPMSLCYLKKLLANIISKVNVSWSPDDHLQQVSSRKDASFHTANALPHKVGDTPLHHEPQNDANRTETYHSWINLPVKTLSCELNNLESTNQNQPKNVNHHDTERGAEVKSVVVEDGSSLSLAHKGQSSPVVLAHNARLRQSLVARQAPRPFRCKMVRSASCYGEECAASLLQEQELEFVNDLNFQNIGLKKMGPKVQIQKEADSAFSNEQDVVESDATKKREVEDSNPHATKQYELLQQFQHSPPMRKSNISVDVSPLRERMANNLASKKLLVKVVKAEELSVKSLSGAYCVVELDEPYQRHSTHCSVSGQLFWDQHLLFDLNNNSKRIALEVFELGKRKKSYSRGRAELLLTHLLTNPNGDGDVETNSFNISDTIRRQIPLIDRSSNSADNASANSAVTSGAVQSIVGGNSLSTAANQTTSANTNIVGQLGMNAISSITAEFNFMEKATEDIRSRPSPSCVQIQRVHSSKVLQSEGIFNISQDHQSANQSGAFPHSPSLEFSNIKSTSSMHNKIISEHVMHSVTEHLQTDSGEEVDSSKGGDAVKMSFKDKASETKLGASVKTGNVSSPLSSRRTRGELLFIHSVDEEHPTTPSPLIYDTTKLSETSSDGHDSSCDLNELCKELIPSDAQHTNEGSAESDTHFKSPGTTSDDPTILFGSKTDSKENDGLRKRSALLGSTATNSTNNLDLLSDLQRVDSPVSLGSPAVTSRAHSLASRLKSTRILSSGVLRSGKRGAMDEPIGSCSNVSSLALLGPSRQLAGVVAGLSSLASDSAAAPTAAALASAMAVVGATGNWQPQLTVDSDSAHFSGSAVLSDLSSEETVNTSSFGPPVHFVPPPAYIATDSPGTFMALSQPRRSDASNLSLFRIFRHKKKRFRSVGAEKLIYWETNNFDDLDAISTEGYHRILQDDCEKNSTDQFPGK